jgi:hypothetical protein
LNNHFCTFMWLLQLGYEIVQCELWLCSYFPSSFRSSDRVCTESLLRTCNIVLCYILMFCCTLLVNLLLYNIRDMVYILIQIWQICHVGVPLRCCARMQNLVCV